MATRSLIGIERTNNIVEYVYCNFDGYPEHNGVILKNNYNIESIESLIKLGSVSSLGIDIDNTSFYIRDFGSSEDEHKSEIIDKRLYFSKLDKYNTGYRYLYTLNNLLLCYCVYRDGFIEIKE